MFQLFSFNLFITINNYTIFNNKCLYTFINQLSKLKEILVNFRLLLKALLIVLHCPRISRVSWLFKSKPRNVVSLNLCNAWYIYRLCFSMKCSDVTISHRIPTYNRYNNMFLFVYYFKNYTKYEVLVFSQHQLVKMYEFIRSQLQNAPLKVN